jgi:putative glycosyltransferase
MKISIVATLYCSEKYISEFYQRITIEVNKVTNDYEIIFVNDGSPDNSLKLAIQLSNTDFHVIVVDLSRNFGHHKAMMTGLAHAQGESVFLIDSDLEEEPEWLLSFLEQMKTEQCDVVYGIQEQRKGGRFEQWSGQWFWRFFNALSDMNVPANLTTARLMSRRYVDALLQHEEREIFMAGLWYITGFEQSPQIVKKHDTSKSTYSFRKKIALLVNAITSFSNTPLIGIFYMGASISVLASFYISYLVIHWAFFEKPLSGWTSVMASIWLLGGLIVSSIGIIGIYLSKIFSETKRRPYTIVRKIYGRK